VTSRDITARRRLEEGLRAGEQRLRRLIDANIIGVIVVDDEYVTEANDTFLRMLGYTSEDVARKRLRWRELTPDDYDPRERKARSEYLDNGIFSPYEMEFFRKDGSRASVTLSGIVTQKEPLERLCLVLDMSDTKRAEARVRCIAEASKILESSLEYEKSFMELAEFLVEFGADSSEILIQDEGDVRECWNAGVKREFEFWDGGNSSVPEFKLSLYARVIQTGEPEIQNEPNSSIVVPIIAHGDAAGVIAVYKQRPNAYSKDDFYVFEDLGRRAGFALQHAQLYRHAQRASRLKDEFVAAISHELRTPLTPILGGVYMLRTEGHDNQVFDQALGLIERNAKAQAKIVDDLLDVSRIISGKLRLNVEPVDLASIIRAAAETVQPAGEGNCDSDTGGGKTPQRRRRATHFRGLVSFQVRQDACGEKVGESGWHKDE